MLVGRGLNRLGNRLLFRCGGLSVLFGLRFGGVLFLLSLGQRLLRLFERLHGLSQLRRRLVLRIGLGLILEGLLQRGQIAEHFVLIGHRVFGLVVEQVGRRIESRRLRLFDQRLGLRVLLDELLKRRDLLLELRLCFDQLLRGLLSLVEFLGLFLQRLLFLRQGANLVDRLHLLGVERPLRPLDHLQQVA